MHRWLALGPVRLHPGALADPFLLLAAAVLLHRRQVGAAAAFAVYLLASVLVVAFGEFPMPVLGFGASPVLGAVLGLGLLASIGPGFRTA